MAQSVAGLPGNVDLYLHVRVLIALILGLSVTRLVSGIAALVQHPSRYPIWPVHLCWVAWALLNVITFWWWEFRLSSIQHWTYGLYFFVCVYASMYYFLSVLLFPQDLDEYKGYQDYFFSRRRWFFGPDRSARCDRHPDKGRGASAIAGTGVSRRDRRIHTAVRNSRENAQPKIPFAVRTQRGGLRDKLFHPPFWYAGLARGGTPVALGPVRPMP